MSLLRRLLLLLVVGVGTVAAIGWWQLREPAPLQSTFANFALTDVTVVNPGVSREEHRIVTVRDGVIRRVGTVVSDPSVPSVGDYRGAFVLPGLIDLHTHLPPDNALKLTAHSLLLYLAHGVTTIREVGDVDGTAVAAARSGIAAERFPGPRIVACGPFVAGGPPRWKNTRILDNPAKAESLVAELQAEGYDCIKSYDDLSLATMRALVAAGTRHGVRVLGHLPLNVAYEDSPLPEIQHLHGVVRPRDLDPANPMTRATDWDSVDSARMNEFVRVTVANHVAHTPTLIATQQLLRYRDYEHNRSDRLALLMPRLYRDVVWHPTDGLPALKFLDASMLARLSSAFEKKKEVVARLFLAGAPLFIGTDVMQPFVVPGMSVWQEMRLFGASGISPEQIWAIATWRAGDYLGVPQLGRIVGEAPADLLVFREDPTRDLAALDTLVAVVSQGRLFTRRELDQALARNEKRFDGLIFDRLSVEVTRRVLAGSVASGTVPTVDAH